ncbi:MAG: N-acetylmuramoyl-L-alanine amidase [Clostridia bacterium]|nr:N-acetylmuramoyl-L-alanine amidase [Clostridia bacterium]
MKMADWRKPWTAASSADRVRAFAGVLLCASALCTAVLLAGAGQNAVQTFLGLPAVTAVPAPTPVPGPLAGLVIAVDAGHGGYDGGAVGRVSGTPEKELNLDVALRTAALLRTEGAEVVMTRTEDIALCDENPPIRKKLQDMQRRAAIITQGGADLVLSIHMNEYAGRSESGPQVFYREGCPAGRLLAGALQGAMIDVLQPRTKRAALGGDYYILTLGVPSALVECGFLSNKEEEALLLDAQYRQRAAEAIAQGVLRWAALPGERPAPLPAVDRSAEEKG